MRNEQDDTVTFVYRNHQVPFEPKPLAKVSSLSADAPRTLASSISASLSASIGPVIAGWPENLVDLASGASNRHIGTVTPAYFLAARRSTGDLGILESQLDTLNELQHLGTSPSTDFSFLF